MSNVISLALHTADATKWTVEQMLDDSLANLRSGELTSTKAVALFLDDRPGQYDVRFSQAGLNASQMLALLEVVKTIILKDMGYI